MISTVSLGQTVGYKSTKVQIFQINFAGEKAKSFSENGIGYGFEVYSDYGRSWGRIYGKARGTTLTGSQAFLDGSSQATSSYTFYQGQFEMGLTLLPIPSREQGMNVFFSAGGMVGYNWLNLKSTSLTTLKPSDSAASFGYGSGIGVEWTLAKAMGRKYILSGEVNYRVETAQLAGQSNFNLSGLAIHLGFGW